MLTKDNNIQGSIISIPFLSVLIFLAIIYGAATNLFGKNASYGVLGILFSIFFLAASVNYHRIFLPILLASVILVPYIPLAGAGLSTDDLLPVLIALIGSLFIFRKRLPHKWLIFLFIGWSVLSFFSVVFHTSDSLDFIKQIFRVSFRPLVSLLIFVYFSQIITNQPTALKILKLIIWIGFFEAIFCIVAVITGFQGPYGIGIEPIMNSSLSQSVLANAVSGRASGTIGLSANFIASYFVIVAPLAFSYAFYCKKQQEKFLYFGITLTILLAALLTYTRGAIISIGIAFIVYIFLIRKYKWLLILFSITILALAFVPALQETVTDLNPFESKYGRSGRVVLWVDALETIRDNPILGVGPSNYENKKAHNSFLQIGAETGVLNLLITVSLFVGYLLGLWLFFRRNNTKNKYLLAGLLSAGIGFFIQNNSNDLLFLPTVTPYFWVLLPIAAGLFKTKIEKKAI